MNVVNQVANNENIDKDFKKTLIEKEILYGYTEDNFYDETHVLKIEIDDVRLLWLFK